MLQQEVIILELLLIRDTNTKRLALPGLTLPQDNQVYLLIVSAWQCNACRQQS